MRVLSAGLLALSLSTSSVPAADVGPLPAGKPAGIAQANLRNISPLYVLAGAVAIGVVVALTLGKTSAAAIPTSSAAAGVTTNNVAVTTGTTTTVTTTTTT